MSRRETAVPLRHMMDHAKEAVSMARGQTRAELDKDRLLNPASVHLLEIIRQRFIPRREKFATSVFAPFARGRLDRR